MPETKDELRQRFIAARKNHFALAEDRARTWIHILDEAEFDEARVVTSYISYGSEPATADLNAELLRRGITVLMPRMLLDFDLEWVPWSGGEVVANGRLSEPVGAPFPDVAAIDICIVPALHIDGKGNRMGKGRGCYDRALSKLEIATSGKILTIGIVHDGEITEPELPHEPHDVKLKAAATPTSLVRFN